MRGVVSLILQAQNREEPTPTAEAFDPDVFARMYAAAREERRTAREERRRNRERLQQVRLRRQLLAAEGNAGQAVVDEVDDVDIEMILDSDDSDWGSSDEDL